MQETQDSILLTASVAVKSIADLVVEIATPILQAELEQALQDIRARQNAFWDRLDTHGRWLVSHGNRFENQFKYMAQLTDQTRLPVDMQRRVEQLERALATANNQIEKLRLLVGQDEEATEEAESIAVAPEAPQIAFGRNGLLRVNGALLSAYRCPGGCCEICEDAGHAACCNCKQDYL